jgi:hypothetical protein
MIVQLEQAGTWRSLLSFGAFVAVLSRGSATCAQPAVRLARRMVSSSFDLESIGVSAGAPSEYRQTHHCPSVESGQ